jgi:hypothetical protein
MSPELVKLLVPAAEGLSCTRRLAQSNHWGEVGRYTCGKPARWSHGNEYFCPKHSLKGRFIFREGDTGEIVARFDTMEELLANKHLYPNLQMQHIGASRRRNLIP